MGFYVFKGLMKEIKGGVEELAEYLKVDVETLRSTLKDYSQAALVGQDVFGKTTFPHVPALEDTVYYIGSVTPVLHYCMGGLAIDPKGRVLKKKTREGEASTIIPGLYACGEVAGGVHGANRLAGNSLLECVVYGRVVGQEIAGLRTGVKENVSQL